MIMVVICLEVSMLIALAVDTEYGESDADGEALKAATINNMKSHFCEFHEYAYSTGDESGSLSSIESPDVSFLDQRMVSGPAELCGCETVECVNDWVRSNFRNAAIGFALMVTFQSFLAFLGWSVLSPWAERVSEKRETGGRRLTQSFKWSDVLQSLREEETVDDYSSMGAQAKIVTDSWYFESAVAGSVLLLMYVMAKQGYVDPPDAEEQFTLRIVEIYVTVFISFEMWLQILIKLGANLTSPKAYIDYFKDPWNVVDIFVLVVSWLYLLAPSNRWVSIGRVLRIVRPMRSLRLISGVQLVFQCIVQDVQLFKDVGIFLFIALTCFSLVGVTLFRGALQYTCIDDASSLALEFDTFDCPDTLMCQRSHEEAQGTGERARCALLRDVEGQPQMVGNDENGLMGFDNMAQGFVTMIIRMSYDDGVQALSQSLFMNDAASKQMAWGFGLISNIILSFVGLQLMLALVVSALVNASSLVKKNVQDDRVASRLRVSKNKRHDDGGVGMLMEGLGSLAAPLIEGLDIAGQRLEMEHALQLKDWRGKRCGIVRNMCKSIVKSPLWRPIIVMLITLYTICLMANKSTEVEVTDNEMPDMVEVPADVTGLSAKELFWLYSEFVVVAAFVGEFMIKFLGVGSSLYLTNQESLLDFGVLMLTLVGFAFSYMEIKILAAQELGNEYTGIGMDINENTFRGLKMLRVAQLLRMLYKEKRIFRIMTDIFKTWKALVGVVVLVLFSTCMTSIIGMHLIGGSLGTGVHCNESGDMCYPRTNFETFGDGAFASFQFMLGVNWSETISWYTLSYQENKPDWAFLPQVFLCVLFLWSNGILFNLFVAVLLINFGMDEHLKIPAQKAAYWKWAKRHIDKGMALVQAMHDDMVKGEEQKNGENSSNLVTQLEEDLNPAKSHQSCYMFKPSSKLRQAFADVITGDVFPAVWIIVIIMSCLSISFQSQHVTELMGDPNSTAGQIYYWGFSILELLVVLLFIAEAVMKSIACGFVLRCGGMDPYLRDGNNIADFCFLVAFFMSYVPLITNALALDHVTLTLIRNLGPMVGILQSQAIRGVLQGFASSVPGVMTVSVPIAFLLGVFSIVGVELYGGRMQRCSCAYDAREAVLTAEEAVDACSAGLNETTIHAQLNTTANISGLAIHAEQCQQLGTSFAWDNDPNIGSFDDVFEGLQFLYVALTAGYMNPMHAVMDVTTAGHGPMLDNSFFTGAIFFVLLHTVFTLFLMNIFIGVISITFSKQSGKSLVTAGQKRWSRCDANVRDFNPTLDKQLSYQPIEGAFLYGYRMSAFNLVLSKKFSFVSNFFILLNSLLLGSEHYPLRIDEYDVFLNYANSALLAWFTVEMALRIFSFGFNDYLSDKGLLFDGFIVLGSILNKFLTSKASGMELFRIFRSLRILLVARGAGQSLQHLMAAVATCLLKATDILLINLLTIYLFSIVGMIKFGTVENPPQLCDDSEIERLGECYTNFSTFFNSFCSLVQFSVGMEYNEILGAIRVFAPDSSSFAFLYFAAYYFMSVFMCINLFIVSVLDNFDSLTEVDQDIDFKHFWGFTFAWADLTIGAHACPSLGLAQAHEFVSSLKDIVKDEQSKANRKAVKVTGFTKHDIKMEVLERSVRTMFQNYGKVASGNVGVDIRKLHGVICHAIVVFEHIDAKRMKELTNSTSQLKFGEMTLQCEESRAGKFAAGVATISLPGQLRDELGSVTLRIDSAVLLPETSGAESPRSPTTAPTTDDNRMHPYFRLTSRAKHLRHGGHHVTETTRPGHTIEKGEDSDSSHDDEEMGNVKKISKNFENTPAKSILDSGAEFVYDESFDFHCNEHSDNFMVTLHDARNYDGDVIGEVSISLKKVKSCADPTQLTFDISGMDGAPSMGQVTVTVSFSPVEGVPDWHYMSDFASDNLRYKPKNCGLEGWVWLKGPNDSSFHQRFLYAVMDPEPCICYLDDINSEHQLVDAAIAGKLSKRIVKIPAGQINTIKNCTISEHSGPSKAHKMMNLHRSKRDAKTMHLAVLDCEFEFDTNRGAIDKHHVVTNTRGHHHKWDMDTRIGTLWVHIERAKALPVMDRDGACDGYCRVAVDGQRLHTATLHDTVNPRWNEAFYFPVRCAEQELMEIEVFDDDFGPDVVIGKISVPLDGIIAAESGSTDGSAPFEKWVTIEPTKKSPKLTGEITTLGQVHIRIKFCPRDEEQEVIRKWTLADIKAERIMPKTEAYRFRTLTNERKYGWLFGLNWLTKGCPDGLAGLNKETHSGWTRMPPAALIRQDTRRAVLNPAEMDLPFGRLRNLFYNLRRFQCLGVKESRAYLMYATFQIELYAWKLNYEHRAKTVADMDPHEIGSKLEVRDPNNMDYPPTRWPWSLWIVV